MVHMTVMTREVLPRVHLITIINLTPNLQIILKQYNMFSLVMLHFSWNFSSSEQCFVYTCTCALGETAEEEKPLHFMNRIRKICSRQKKAKNNSLQKFFSNQILPPFFFPPPFFHAVTKSGRTAYKLRIIDLKEQAFCCFNARKYIAFANTHKHTERQREREMLFSLYAPLE